MAPRPLLAALPAALAGALALAAPAAAAPANDAPGGAAALGMGPSRAVEQTTLGSSAGGEPGTGTAPAGCARMGKTVWFAVRGTGHALRVATAGSAFDTVAAIYDTATTPTEANRLACNDDAAPGDTKAAVTAPTTVRGNTYLVQVGGKVPASCTLGADSCAPFGALRAELSGTPRPTNDDRADAAPLGTGTPLTTDTTGATSEPGELLSCGASPFAATVWFLWTAPGPGTPTFDARATFTGARPADTVMTVYRATGGAVAGCNDDAGAPGGASRVTLGGLVARGEQLLVQAGAKGTDAPGLGEGPLTVQATLAPPDVDGDGFPPPQDCDDANPRIHPGAVEVPDDGVDQNCDGVDAVNLDRDGDGANRPQDCDDANPAIHPGAVDVPQDGIDQDCTGGDAPFPLVGTSIVAFSATFRSPAFTRFTDLHLRTTLAGETVTVSCRGRGCPRPASRRTVLRRASRTRSVLGALKRAKLRRGAVVEVRVTVPREVGRVARLTIRAPAAPRRVDLCLPPRAKRPVACP